MSGHTPGPWHVAELCANRIKVESHQDGYVAEVWRYGADGDANARLIAASPELLDAAFFTQRSATGDFANGYTIRVTGHEMEAIRAAIAKSKGREP